MILCAVSFVNDMREMNFLRMICVVQSAMKMESAVSAPVSGHIKRVLVNEGDSLNQGDLLVEIVH